MITIPQECFRFQPKKTKSYSYILEKINFSGRFTIQYRGLPYPVSGIPYPEAILAINYAKFGLLLMLSFWPLLLIPYFRKKIIGKYVKIMWGTIQPLILKQEHMTACSSEVENILGKSQLSLIIAAIIEYDDAYRLRIQDLCTATTKELLLRFSRGEVKRLGQLYLEREQSKRVKKNLKTLIWLAPYLLFVPKIKRLFLSAVQKANFNNLMLTEADLFTALQRTGYNYVGLTEEQKEMLLSKYPKPEIVEV